MCRGREFQPRLLSSLLLFLCLGARLARAQDAPSEEGPQGNGVDVPRVHLIGNDAIIRMSKAGLDENVLLQTIRLQPGHYDTGPDDLIALRQAGVSGRVIEAMQAHQAGLNVRPGSGSGSGEAGGDLSPTPAPLAPGIDEIGVYYKRPGPAHEGDSWELLKNERVFFKSGGAVKSIVTHGIVNKDMNGHVDGAKSDLVLPTGVQILIYAPNGTAPDEYQLLRFREHSDNREFRVLTGGVFHSESGSRRDEIEFHPTRKAPRMYTFTVPADIEKGEYGILPPGSSNPQGLAGTGRIFTFSIRE